MLVYELVVFGLQRLPLGVLRRRQRHLLAAQLPQAELVAIRKVGRDLDPAPAFRADRIGLALEPFGHQPLDQRHVLQPAAIVALEQVAQHGAAFGFVRLADEPRPLVRRAHGAFGELAADDIRLLAVGRREPLPDLLLAFPIPRDGEGHQLVQRHAVLGVDLQQLRRHRRQPQPLLDHRDRHEERRRDLLLGLALLAQRQEGAELVERVQRRALDVFGQRILLGDAAFADHARDRRRLGQALLLDQQFERPEAPTTGRNFEEAGLVAVGVQHRPHGQRLQQRAPGDVVGELLDGDARLDPADVAGAEQQLVEGDVARGAERDFRSRRSHGRSPRRARRDPLSTRSLVTKPAAPLSLFRSEEPQGRGAVRT